MPNQASRRKGRQPSGSASVLAVARRPQPANEKLPVALPDEQMFEGRQLLAVPSFSTRRRRSAADSVTYSTFRENQAFRFQAEIFDAIIHPGCFSDAAAPKRRRAIAAADLRPNF
jgi:hypothetical protein